MFISPEKSHYNSIKKGSAFRVNNESYGFHLNVCQNISDYPI